MREVDGVHAFLCGLGGTVAGSCVGIVAALVLNLIVELPFANL